MSELPHGSIDTYWQGKMLVINLSQSFNLAGVQRATQKIRWLVDHKPVPYWVRCYVYHDDEGLGPLSGKEALLESIRYGVEQGNRLICVVRGNLLNKENLSMVAKQYAVPIQFFDSVEDAEAFVNQTTLLTE